MDNYISLVLTSYESATIRRIESLLPKAGLRGQYSEFKPAIPQLKPSFVVTVKTNRIEVQHVRGRIRMILSGIPGGDSVDVQEFTVEAKR